MIVKLIELILFDRLGNFLKKVFWKIIICLFFGILVSLGVWQVHRGLDRLSLEGLFLKNSGKSKDLVLSWDEFKSRLETTDYSALRFQTIDLALEAKIMQAIEPMRNKIFLLDNQIKNRQQGYDIIVPVLINSQQLVFVNQGWVKKLENSRNLEPEKMFLEKKWGKAWIDIPSKPPKWLIKELSDAPGSWPMRIQKLDLEAMFDILKKSTNTNLDNIRPLPVLFQLEKPKPADLAMAASKNFAYAGQWFIFALLFLWYAKKIGREFLNAK
ncbi:MAG: SURF1 family cytochrome oxidase biogenesis protein [Gammaproteobacteria bacterium]